MNFPGGGFLTAVVEPGSAFMKYRIAGKDAGEKKLPTRAARFTEFWQLGFGLNPQKKDGHAMFRPFRLPDEMLNQTRLLKEVLKIRLGVIRKRVRDLACRVRQVWRQGLKVLSDLVQQRALGLDQLLQAAADVHLTCQFLSQRLQLN